MAAHGSHKKRNDPLHVAILWHMHQPIYRQVESGDFLLPWVRLHALKDYCDMVGILAEFPDVRATFNIVPSLIEQLKDYTSRGASDAFLDVTRKEAETLSVEDKLFLMKNFFSLNFDNMIQPFPRYKELLEKRGHVGDLENLRSKIGLFSAQDYRDLQVWFHLAWSGRILRETENVRALFLKGRNYTEEDKLSLLDIQMEALGQVLPTYREARERGQIELSTSPYYHPILPLLCNINSAREALPNIELPNHDFHHPEDAVWHIRKAERCFLSEFGEPPAGMWPSEGSVSEEILPLIRESGITWVASDEEILRASLIRSEMLVEGAPVPMGLRYRPHRINTTRGPVSLFFRDHLLSDMIGFTYSTYGAEAAAEDFLSRLLLIRKQLPEDGKRYIVPVILDGENAWEYYPENGVPFLRALYGALSKAPQIRTCTFSEYLSLEEDNPVLPRLRAGSWIYGSFSTWIGHPEKNRGWDLLAATRKKFEESARNAVGDEARQKLEALREHLMIAEGSDWFWWYGEDHYTEYEQEFDQLFREHLKAVWKGLGEVPPEELSEPIIQKITPIKVQRPFELITPELDGLITDYFEWLAAGYFSNQYTFTTMQQVHRLFSGFYFGFDHTNLYVRLDVDDALLNDRKYPFIVELHFRKPGNLIYRMTRDTARDLVLYQKIRVDDAGKESEISDCPLAGVRQIVELGVPFADLGIHENQALEFAMKIFIGDNLAERMPRQGYLAQKIAIDDLEKYYWVV